MGLLLLLVYFFSLTTLGSSDVALVISFIAAFIYAFISIVQSKLVEKCWAKFNVETSIY